jgi:hypothetical protein
MSEHQRLVHDAAWAAAKALLDTVGSVLYAHEHAMAFHEFYQIVHAAIESYDVMRTRQDTRLCKPSSN